MISRKPREKLLTQCIGMGILRKWEEVKLGNGLLLKNNKFVY
jgi:hypothetical protein